MAYVNICLYMFLHDMHKDNEKNVNLSNDFDLREIIIVLHKMMNDRTRFLSFFFLFYMSYNLFDWSAVILRNILLIYIICDAINLSFLLF